MSSYIHLGEQDFYVDKGAGNRNVLCTTQKSIIFVFFHANPSVCKFCDTAKPEFIKSSQYISGAKFALCNLSSQENKNLINTSFNTIIPLNKVPLFILFVNGRPFMNYTGEKTFKSFVEFMKNVMERLQTQQVFNQSGIAQTVSAVDNDRTPHGLAYDYDIVSVSNPNIGSVTCEEGICYLTSKEGLSPSSAESSPAPSAAPQRQQAPYQQALVPTQPRHFQTDIRPQP